MTHLHFPCCFTALLLVGALATGCGSVPSSRYGYGSDSKTKAAPLAIPPSMSGLQQPGKTEPPPAAVVVPAAASGTPDSLATRSTTSAAVAQDLSLAPRRPPTPGNRDVGSLHPVPELTLGEGYDRAWIQVGLALERGNFTIEDRDRSRGVYLIRYVDPTDISSAQQGFWSQIFHGRKEKVAKQYRIGVRPMTPDQTRVAVVGEQGDIDTSRPARQIIALLADQFH
ncbi:outer membrane protein assembly factor BamC [Paraburkholderia sediminicola]|nr:outer membrane protein assembly factor BamC [Paraburkholderia sediminicola]